MGHGHDKKLVSEVEAQDAMKPVAMPLPRLPPPKLGMQIAGDQAPNLETVIDAQRAALEGIGSASVVDSLSEVVEDIYDNDFAATLSEVKADLAEVPPPSEDSDWVLKLLGVAVELVATASLGEVGNLAAKALASDGSASAKAVADAFSSVAKRGGKASSDWAEGSLKRTPGQRETATLQHQLVPGGTLVDEFTKRVSNHLRLQKHEALDRLRVTKANAARQDPKLLEVFDDQLKDAVGDGTLGTRFREKVAMEWANFVARISLGARPPGQVTNMIGANAIGGWHEAGTAATSQWRGDHDGFIDVMIDVTAAAPILQTASVSNHPGVGRIVQGMAHEDCGDGSEWTLATLPMFRRIWLKSGDTKLEANPAFVMTPEGALEVNYDDPLLAHLGGGAPPASASSYDPMPGAHGDANAWSERGTRAAAAMAGARRIVTSVLTNADDVRKLNVPSSAPKEAIR